MGALQDCGADSVRLEHLVSWALPRVQLGPLRLPDLFPDTPAECRRQVRGGKDGLGLWGGSSGVIAARQGIRLDVLGPRPVGEGKVEPGKQQVPSRLPGVEALGGVELLQIFVVGPHNERMFPTFQPVTNEPGSEPG